MSNNKSSAFPIPPQLRDTVTGDWTEPAYEYGLSKREWFAGMALSRIAHELHGTSCDSQAREVAKDCRRFADAVIAELAEEPKP